MTRASALASTRPCTRMLWPLENLISIPGDLCSATTISRGVRRARSVGSSVGVLTFTGSSGLLPAPAPGLSKQSLTEELAPSEHLVGVDVMAPGNRRDRGSHHVRLLDDLQLLFEGMRATRTGTTAQRIGRDVLRGYRSPRKMLAQRSLEAAQEPCPR